jgi:hypothetical protein
VEPEASPQALRLIALELEQKVLAQSDASLSLYSTGEETGPERKGTESLSHSK